MLQGTPQDQIPQPPNPSSIPVQAVDADQLPREKGLSYEEVTAIVGSLYLDSHHTMKVREEQFGAMTDEYERASLQLQSELKGKQMEIENLTKANTNLRRELEIRDARPTVAPSDNGDDAVSDN